MFFFGKKKKEKKQEQAVPVVNKEELIAKEIGRASCRERV